MGAEKGVKAELFGEPGHREQLVVGRALLRFREDSQAHGRGPYCPGDSARPGDEPRDAHASRGEPRRTLAAMLNVDRWPKLHEPLLVAALTGWVDAGFAGAGTVEALGAQLDGAEQFATLDLTDLLDLQQTRPTARFVEGGLRVIDWPRIALVAGRAGRDIVLVHGPEPSIKWPTVAAEIVDAAQRLGVREAVTIAGM